MQQSTTRQIIVPAIVMQFIRYALLGVFCSLCLLAHPMGNFSINHYSRIDLRQRGPELTYILDFAEIPTSELFGEWGDASTSNQALQKHATLQAAEWAKGLLVTVNAQTLPVKWTSVQASTIDGAGGMPVLRVVMKAGLGTASTGAIALMDRNFANRTGWKEIVIAHGKGVLIDRSNVSDNDLSKALTVYPADLTVTPPQNLDALVSWHSAEIVATAHPAPAKEATPIPPAPPAVTKPESSFATQQPNAAGTVNRGDYLSTMLRQRHFGFTAILLGLLAAFGLGAVHALSPGHGKTIVAAYLVGSRGTLKHAGILGLTVTFTHTISVFLLGIGVLFFQKYVIPEKVVPILGAISGLSIVVIGAYLLYQRSMALVINPASSAARSHSHSHSRSNSHSHSHGGRAHSHTMPDKFSMGSLLGLGVSGGMVPCPSALVVLLSAISLGQVALGLALLAAFSTGLAIVLMAIGGVVLYGKNLLPKNSLIANHPVLRLLPVFSSVVVIVVGLLMTLAAAGIIQPVKLLT